MLPDTIFELLANQEFIIFVDIIGLSNYILEKHIYSFLCKLPYYFNNKKYLLIKISNYTCFFFIQTNHGDAECTEKFNKLHYIYEIRTIYFLHTKKKTHNSTLSLKWKHLN